MNPYTPLIALLVLIATGIGGFLYGGHVREAEIVAEQAKEKDVRQETRDDAREGAASAIKDIEVKHVVVNQKVQTEIREKPVYRDCINTDDGLRLINEALTGQAQSADNGKLPRTAADH